jgi:hypothetical protein
MTIRSPGNRVFSGTFSSPSRIPAVASPQTKLSSGAVRNTDGGPENAATVEGGRLASGNSSEISR